MSTSQMSRNGLIKFTFHSEDGTSDRRFQELLDQLAAALKSDKPVERKSQEVNHRLKMLLEGSPLRSFVPPEVPVKESEFESVGIPKRLLTDTLEWKFRQKYQKVPVYGSQITLEVDEDDNEVISINSAIGGYIDTSASPDLNPDEVKAKIWEKTGNDLRDSDVTPTLYYYFDNRKKDWRLVYIVETRPKKTEKQLPFQLTHQLVDYVIDAHDGDLVSKLPRMRTLQAESREKEENFYADSGNR